MTAIPEAVDIEKPPVAFTFRTLHSFAEAESLQGAWDNLVLRSGADIYQTFDWCRLWWRHYSERRHLHLLLCFSGEELVGMVPAFTETLWLGPARLRVAKLVGADYTLNLCNLPVLANVLESVVSRAIHYFLGEIYCDLLLFGPLSGPAACLDQFISIGRREGRLVERTEALGEDCNTYFELPNSFDEYLKSLGNKQRSNLKRRFGKLSQAHRTAFDAISSSAEVEREFAAFCKLHDAQWRAAGKLGHFGDWPHAERFNRDLVHTLGAKGMVRFDRILADDQVISSQYSFMFGGTDYWRLPARVFGSEWDEFGLGVLSLAKKIEACVSEGCKRIEAGRGHYEYKLQMGGREWPLRTVQFVRRGTGVSARVRGFKAFATLLNLAYYKIVFARIAPRLPALRRPLWRTWIRSKW